MRIETGAQTVSGVSSANRTSGVAKTRQNQGSQTAQSPFQVQLTNMVDKLSQVQPSSGELRPEKVAEISSKLAQGNYSISGNSVAEKLLLSLKS